MFIKSYGLFWQRDEVEWNPGKGKRGGFRLLGRHGAYLPRLRLADFRHQKGIYILYGNHGADYVGLTKKMGLGRRLKDHLYDDHKNDWDRFSWFGFRAVLKGADESGFNKLGKLAQAEIGNPESVITDVEALLIRAMGLSNIRQMNFTDAEEWEQIKKHEVDNFLERIA